MIWEIPSSFLKSQLMVASLVDFLISTSDGISIESIADSNIELIDVDCIFRSDTRTKSNTSSTKWTILSIALSDWR